MTWLFSIWSIHSTSWWVFFLIEEFHYLQRYSMVHQNFTNIQPPHGFSGAFSQNFRIALIDSVGVSSVWRFFYSHIIVSRWDEFYLPHSIILRLISLEIIIFNTKWYYKFLKYNSFHYFLGQSKYESFSLITFTVVYFFTAKQIIITLIYLFFEYIGKNTWSNRLEYKRIYIAAVWLKSFCISRLIDHIQGHLNRKRSSLMVIPIKYANFSRFLW